ncbi:3' exoribonuclease family, domain 1-domain-containing protein [Lenzites betulinus]|nr:3' exoribonuclease family, domain 1-domain-containing protein [Lenzites betulinus]
MSSALAIRPRGRRPEQLRDCSIVYEGLDRVDGSARFSFGFTSCLSSVSGPIEVRPTLENPSQATLDIQIRPLAAIAGTDSKALSATLKSIFSPALLLSRHPRTLVQIVGQALCGTDSGNGLGSAGRGWNASLTASLINATTAAFVNAGSVPMKGVVCAVAIGRLQSESEGPILILDPEETELPRLAGSGCFAFLFSAALSSSAPLSPNFPPCSLLWTNYTTAAPFDVAQLSKARELAEEGARQVWLKLKESVGSLDMSAVSKVEVKPQLEDHPGAMEVDDEKVEI